MRKSKALWWLTKVALGGCFAVVLSTCDAGLGPKVDVTAPKVAITTPSATGGYYKGTLSLAGTATDDRGVTKVEVSYTGDSGTVTKSAALSGNDWTLEIASNASGGLPEGKNVISVVASDASGKTATDSVLVYIDNIAPTVLITYPLSHGPSNALLPRFTDTIDIKGEVYDQSPISSVTVSLIDSTGNPISAGATKVADGTNTWSVRFALKNNLPLTDGQNYYYTVETLDAAGNKNTWYYSSNDIYALLPADTPFPTVTELGTLENAGSGTSASGISYSGLTSKRMGPGSSSATYGDFKYVATAVPTIAYSNLDPTKSASQNTLGPGSVLTGNIIPPVNTGAIEISSIVVKIYNTTTLTTNMTPLVTITDSDANSDNDNIKLTPLGDSQGFTVNLKDGSTGSGGSALPAGPYIVTITAKSSGSQSTTQAAAFFIDSEAPTLTETAIGNASTFKSTPFSFQGTAISSLGLANLAFTESKDGGAVNSSIPTVTTFTAPTGAWTSQTFPVGAPASPTDGTYDGTYTYELKLTGTSGKTTSLYRSVTFDHTAPSVEVTSVTPVVGTKTVNGTISFSATASDGNGLTGVRYWVLPTTSAAPTWTTAGSTALTTTPYSATIDTTALTDLSNYTIWVLAQDKATNVGSAKFDLTVDQSSDNPVFQLTTMDAAVTGTTLAVAKANLLETGAKALATVTDDDKIIASTLQVSIDAGPWTAVTKTGTDARTVSFEQDLSSLSEGVHTLSFRGSDNNATPKTAVLPAVSFVIDKSPPAVVVNSNTGWYKDTISLSGTAADPNGLDAAAPLVIKDESSVVKATLTPDGAGAWTTASPIDITAYGSGSHTWSVTAKDAVGKTSTQSITFQIDRTPPTFNVNNLAANFVVTTASYLILGDATDAASGVGKVEFSLDGGTTWNQAIGTNAWTVSLAGLTDSLSNQIQIRATDKSSNVSSVTTIPFKVDLATPNLLESTSGLTASLAYRNADVILGGVVTDGNGVTHVVVSYQKDGAAAVQAIDDTDNNGTWTWTLAAPGDHSADGLYDVTIVATDGASRTTTLTRRIDIDTKSPDLTVSSPVGAELVSSPSYTVGGQVNDNGGKGVTSLQYSKNSTNGTDGTWTAITLGGLNWTVTGVNFSTGGEGSKSLWVKASDGLNPDSLVHVTFNYDTAPPTLSETTVNTSAQVIKAGNFTLSGSANDTNALQNIVITATKNASGQGTVFSQSASGTWTYNKTVDTSGHTDDGLWVYTLTATDVAGRTTSLSRTVLVDTTLPSVSIGSLTQAYYDSSLPVSGTAADGTGNVSGLNTIEYSFDNSTWTALLGTDTWYGTLTISSGLLGADGTKTLYVRATDRAGNTQTGSTTFLFDTAVPTLSADHSSGQTVSATAVLFTGTAADTNALKTWDDPVDGMNAVMVPYIEVNDGSSTTKITVAPDHSWSWTFPNTAEGSFSLTFAAMDIANRVTTTTRQVLIDKTKPTVAINSPSPGEVVSTSTITVTGTAADGAGSGVAGVQYSLDGTTWVALNGTTNWNKSIALGSEGTKTLSVRATDAVGLVTSPVQTVTFALDQSPPTLTETVTDGGLGPSTSKRNATFTLAGTAGDTNGLKTWDDPVDGINGVLVPYIEIDYGSTSKNVTVGGDSHWSFSYPVVQDGSQDGNVSFTITATDVVNKPTTLTRNVVIDTTQPTIAVDGVISGLNVSTNQVNGNMTFRFSADDSGVGLERNGSNQYVAYYTLVPHSATLLTPTSADILGWTQITSSSSVFAFTFDTTASTPDGSYDLYMAVRDAVPGSTPNYRALKYSTAHPGNPLGADVSLAINQDSDRPIIGFDNLNVAAVQNFDNGLGKNPIILLTIQDDDKVKVSDLEYRIDINNDGLFNTTKDFWNGDQVIGADQSLPDGDTNDLWENEATWYPVEEKPSTDGSLVQAKIKLTGFPQGVFGLQVRARDNTDVSVWTTIYDSSSNHTWQKSGIVPFSVDYGPPSIKVTSPLAGTFKDNLSLAGTSKDLLGVVRVKYTFDGVTFTTVYSNPNPLLSISPSAFVPGIAYLITSLGDTNWSAVGAGGSPTVGQSFVATAAGSGTGLAKIDPAIEIPFTGTIDTSALTTGEYTLQVVATDLGGSDATQQIPITIDKDAPTISFLQPGASDTLNGSSVKVSGEAADNRKVGAVFVWNGLVTDPDPALPSQTSLPSVANPNGLYNAGGYTQMSGTGVWNTFIDTTASVLSGANGYRIRVVAVDAIGNVGTPVDRLVTVDQETDRPSVGFSNLNIVTPSRLPAGNVTIIGTVSDDDSVNHSSIQIRLDRNGDGDYNDAGEGWVAISNPPPSDSVVVSWSHEITDMTSQGNRHVQVRARDTHASDYSTGYGWNVSPSVAFFVDNGPPTLNLTSPTIGQRFNTNQFTLTGDTNDTNGIQKIVVWVDDNDNQTRDSGEETTLTGPDLAATAMVNSFTYTILTQGTTDFTQFGAPDNNPGTTFVATGPGTGTGTLTKTALTYDETSYPISQVISSFSNSAKSVKAVQVSSYDISGASTTRDLSIVYDPIAPTATINTPADSSTVNGNLLVAGLASDNYQLTNVYYNVSPTASPAPSFPSAYTALSQTYSWNFSVDTTALSDGNYTIRVVAKDSAGNDSSASPAMVNLSVLQTSDRPVIHVLTLNEAGTAVENLLPGSLQISGTVADDDAVDHTKIQVRTRTLPAGSFGAWTAISGPPASNVSLATWSHTFTGLTDGQYEFQVRAADVNDGGSFGTYSSGTSATVKFAVDLNIPAGTIAAPTQGSSQRTSVAINGTGTDASGVKKVTIAYNTGSGYGAETVLVNDTDPSDGYASPVNWNDTYTVTGSNDGQTFYRVTITDAFDKVRTYEQYFTVDTQAPSVSFQLPAAAATVNGSVEVRGSSTDANQITAVYMKVNNNAGPGTWAPGTTPTANGWTLINGTYNWNSRFKSTALSDGAATIYLMAEDAAGNRSDPTQSANQQAITVSQATNSPVITLTTTESALLDNSGTVTGTITDDDGVDVSTLEISFDNGSTWRSVSSPGTNALTVNFSHSLSAGAGVPESATPYSVLVRVKDIGENFDGGDFSGTQDIAPVQTTSSVLHIKKDDNAPTSTVTTLDNGLGPVGTLQGAYLSDKLSLTGTAADGVGVSNVEARLVGVTSFATVTNTGTNYSTWTWSQTGLSLSGTSVSLEIRATDVNGRQTVQAYTLLVDTTKPSVGFDTSSTNPDTATGTYNGNVTFRGNAGDNVQIGKVYYKFAAADPGAPNSTFTGWTLASATYSWTAALDTTTVNNTAVDQADKLWAVSVDGAGNVSNRQSLSFTINQGSDKPVISVTAPTAAQVFDTNAKAQGTVTDDDGLATVEVRIDRNNDGDFADTNEGYVPVDLPASVSGKNINLEHVLSTLADGDYKLQVRARDTLFVSTGATPFNENETGVVSFSIDTAPPSLTLNQITVPDRYAVAADRVITSSFNGTYVNNDLTLKFAASDASGIASVQVSTDGTVWTNATSAGSGVFNYPLAIDVVGHSFDGTKNIQYRATDNHGKSTTALVTLIVDTVEPTIGFTSPASMSTDVNVDAPNVNGTVTVLGTVSDSSALSSVTLTGGTDNQALTNLGNNLGWKVTFDSNVYANGTHSVSQGSNIWRMPIKAIAADIAGNKSQAAASTGYIDVDPNSDNPIVTVASPANGGSVSGSFLVSGSVADDDGAQSVRLQIDLNNDGVYGANGGFNGYLDLNNDGDHADDFETETTYKTVTVTNGAWSIVMNTASELNKSNLIARGLAGATGTIGFQITPVDINGTLGTPQTQTVYIDSTAPTIVGLATDGTTPTTNPTPATGTLQKGTITVRALFKDDQSIPTSSMQVSFDGGTNFTNISAVSGASISADVGSGNPYTYRITIPVDSTTAVSGGNGDLQISLKLTDQTFKQTTSSLTYHVDNTLPTVAFNSPTTLSFQGTQPNETYSFYGGLNSDTVTSNNGLTNEVFGQASDSGAVSGVDHVNVYFVKSGNFINPTSGATTAVTNSVTGDGLYNQAGSLATGVPFTESSSYVITIDKRTELGQFDLNGSLGDADGFQESLKAKSGYDEWFAYFDSTKLPDGPLTVYFVAYDQAGNKRYGTASGQVTNNPPSVTGFTVNASAISGSPLQVKTGGTFTLVSSAADTGTGPNIVSSTWKVSVLKKFAVGAGSSIGTQDGSFVPFFYGTGGVRNFSGTTGGGTGSATSTVSVNTSAGTDGFADGFWYLLEAQVSDIDGNTVVKDFYLLTNNSDTTPPTVTIDPFTQSSVSPWTSGQTPLRTDVTAGNISTGTPGTINLALPSWMVNGTRVMFAGSSAPGGLATATVYYIVNNGGSSFQLAATSGGSALAISSASGTYDLVSGGHVEVAADSLHNGTDADVAGTVLITGTTFDGTDVSSLTVEIDGVSIGNATLSNKTGDAINGYTYNWTYAWDTAKQGVTIAKDNVVVRAYATDPTANSLAAGSRPTVTVDAAPYITAITDSTGLSTDVLRGSNGKYSIRSDAANVLTVKGYNFGTSAPTVYVSPTASAPASGVTATVTWVNNNQISVNKGLTKSGWLTVRANTVDSFNNMNNNARTNNIESGADPRTNMWNDDRYLWVWANTQISLASITGTTSSTANLTYYNSDMVMNGNQPEFSFADESNGIVVYNTGDTAATRRTGYRLTRPAAMAEATVNGTLQRFIATSFDSTWTTSGDNTGFLEVTGYADQTTDGNGAANGPSVNTDGGLRWPTIQGIDYYAPGNTSLGVYRNTNRFAHPRIKAVPSTLAGPNYGANLFVSYFDTNSYQRSLNFVSFRMTGNTATNNNLATAAAGYNKSTDVIEIPGTKGFSSEYYDMALVGSNGVALAYYDETNHVLKLSASANAYNSTGAVATEGRTNTAYGELSTITITNSLRTSWVGRWFTVYNGASAYSFWYDTTGTDTQPGGLAGTITRINISAVGTGTNSAGNRTAMGTATATAISGVAGAPFTVNSAANPTITTTSVSTTNATDISSNLANATPGSAVGTTAATTQGNPGATWTNLTVDSSGDVGQYVSMVSDGGNKLYLAYYDFDNANLKVARVLWNSGVPTVDQIVSVDNYLSAGTWTSISMITDSNLTGQATAQPVISYYSDSYNGTKKPIRFAFPLFDATTGTLQHGTTGSGTDDTYNGSWEVVTVPAITTPQGGADQFNRVKLGVYSNGISLPVLGWQGTKLEYAKLQPNN